MIYDYRIDILRDRVKIGEALTESCNIKFDSTSTVTRAIQLKMSSNFPRMQKIQTKYQDYIYFDGIRCFDGSWSFVSSIYKSETYEFDMFKDRLQPILIINGVEYSLGIYMVISAPQTISDKGTFYQIEAYDETMILKQSAFKKRVTYSAGSNYIDLIEQLITECGLANVVFEKNSGTLQTDREFEPGDTYIDAINELLDEINYRHIYANSNGDICITKKSEKTTADFIYKDTDKYSIIGDIKVTTDIYDLPNVLVGVFSNADSGLTYRYERINDDPNSKISTYNRGYQVVKVYESYDFASEQDLHDYIDQKYIESTQSTETLDITTLAEGNHEVGNTIQIQTNQLDGLFVETAWQIDFGVSSRMKHTLERKVFI